MKVFFKSATLLLATIAITFGIQSCNSKKPIDQQQLSGYWTLKSIDGDDATDVFKGNIPGMQFDFTNNMISGNGGCNNFSGSFTLNDENEFSAPNLVATQMACFQDNKEKELMEHLSGSGVTISMNNDNELVFTHHGKDVLKFTRGEAPSKATEVNNNNEGIVNTETLTGKWKLTNIEGSSLDSLFTGPKPTMEIESDGKVFGNAGCNTYRTTYEISENTMTFKPMITTKMACPDMKGEQMFTSLFESPLQAGMNGNKLTLFRGGNVILEFEKETSN